MSKKVCAHATIGGKVQGVFYRAETEKAARRNSVAGWVKNKRNGDVEAVFQGEEDNVNEMIKWLWKGSPASKVTKVESEYVDITESFDDFNVRY